MRGNLDPVQTAQVDDRARAAEQVMKDIEQAGRGLVQVRNQLGTGVPRGNELRMLIIVQGFINSAAFELSNMAIPSAPLDDPGKKIVI